jgi:hypothetical protein
MLRDMIKVHFTLTAGKHRDMIKVHYKITAGILRDMINGTLYIDSRYAQGNDKGDTLH